MVPRTIRTAALVHIRDRRLLQTRSAGKGVFYMAGGKLDPGESAVQALHREVREELGVEVGAFAELGVFECEAYGHPPGTGLHMTCFTAELSGEPTPASEIAELRYFTGGEYEAMPESAPGSLLVFRHLHARDLIDW
ncbi:MAG: NUDIX domain-containing protein [Nocardia sp.]|nr:NUDIX domain-containing protein [Nocardia sp.]